MKTFIDNTIYPAGFFVRSAAYLIDIILLNILICFFRFPLFLAKTINSDFILFKPILFNFNIFDIFFYLIGSAYFVLMVYYSGSTIGKKLMNIKVVDSNGEKLTFFNVIYRETIGRYLSSLLFIGYIILATDKNKRALHDILCNTMVIYSKDNFSMTKNNIVINNNNPIIEESKENFQNEQIKQAEINEPENINTDNNL